MIENGLKYVGLRTACKKFRKSDSTMLRWKDGQGGFVPTKVGPDGKLLYGVPLDRFSPSELLADTTEVTESPPLDTDPDFPDTEPEYPTLSDVRRLPVPEEATGARVRKQVSIYDAHVPFHDKATWRACLQLIADEQPDEVILVGDFLDVSSMSSHTPGGWEIGKLSTEVQAGKEAIAELREAAGDARIVYLEGNHESRPRRLAMVRLSQIADLVALDQLLGLREQGIEWHPEGKEVRRGDLHFVHGYWVGENHAKKHLSKLLWPGIVYGHTHRPQMYSMADGDNRVRVAYGMPCMCELSAEWMRGQPTGWVNGFGISYVDSVTGQFNVFPVLSSGGRFMWGGKLYDGNLST